jgi:hypothetical protein
MTENTPRDEHADTEPSTPATEATDETATTGESDDQQSGHDHVRTESWPCAGPAELDLSVDVGQLSVTLDDDASTVAVQVRADESRASWTKGLSGLLNWIGGATGSSGSIRIGGREFDLGGRDFPFGGLRDVDLHGLTGQDLDAEAVRSAEVTWSEPGRRLVVRSSTALPLRVVPLFVTVRAPAGSGVTLRTGAGEITVTGRAGAATVQTGSGNITLGAVDGDVDLKTGSGRASVGPVAGRAQAKTGSGALSLAALAGPGQIRAGSGDLRLGVVRADLFAKSGSGDLVIDDAEAGQLELSTGSGDLRVGVHAAAVAELDLSSGSGRVRSELQVSDTAPASGAARLRIRGRTGNGDVLVTRALSPTGAAGERG